MKPQCSLADYQLTEVALARRDKSSHGSRSVSTSDIMRLQQQDAEVLAREAMIARSRLMRGTKTKSVIISLKSRSWLLTFDQKPVFKRFMNCCRYQRKTLLGMCVKFALKSIIER